MRRKSDKSEPVGHHNGSKELVLRAIKLGVCQVATIMSETGLDEQQVRNAIKRLQDSGDIRRKTFGGYEYVQQQCPLAEVWR